MSTLIELHVPDFQIAYNFYKLLGFSLVLMEEDYMVIKKEENVLAMYGGAEKVYAHPYFKNFSKNTKRGYATEIVIFVDKIDEYYASLEESVNVVSSLKVGKSNVRDFRIEDPFGFYVRISEPYEVLNRAGMEERTKECIARKGFCL